MSPLKNQMGNYLVQGPNLEVSMIGKIDNHNKKDKKPSKKFKLEGQKLRDKDRVLVYHKIVGRELSKK